MQPFRSIPLLLLLTSCATSQLAPQAEKIKVTDQPADVATCTVLGAVESHPPYILPSDGKNQLINAAAALGADTLFLTSTGIARGKTGMAYRCTTVPPGTAH